MIDGSGDDDLEASGDDNIQDPGSGHRPTPDVGRPPVYTPPGREDDEEEEMSGSGSGMSPIYDDEDEVQTYPTYKTNRPPNQRPPNRSRPPKVDQEITFVDPHYTIKNKPEKKPTKDKDSGVSQVSASVLVLSVTLAVVRVVVL